MFAAYFAYFAIISRTPIATTVENDLFFRQGRDQLNGGGRGTVDFQPVNITVTTPLGLIVIGTFVTSCVLIIEGASVENLIFRPEPNLYH